MFCVVTTCSPLYRYHSCGGTCCLHCKGWDELGEDAFRLFRQTARRAFPNSHMLCPWEGLSMFCPVTALCGFWKGVFCLLVFHFSVHYSCWSGLGSIQHPAPVVLIDYNLCLILFSTIQLWWQGQHISAQCWCPSGRLHSDTAQKATTCFNAVLHVLSVVRISTPDSAVILFCKAAFKNW